MTRILVFILVASLVVVACGGGTSTDPCEGITCSGHGTCDSSSGEAMCTCDEGYAGNLCGECGEGYHDEDGACVVNEVCETESCSGHGTCDDSGGVVMCTCDTGYTGAVCDTCDAGYTGAECDTCAAGYQDNDGNGTCLPDCYTQDCSGHGNCDDSSGTAICACDDGWGGLYCSIEWVAIPGGMFMMGYSGHAHANEQPYHQVSVPSFEIAMTEVTVSQYQACVDAGACSEPDDYTVDSYCNWGQDGREDHPVNCVDWFQALDFCSRVGGRLPSEAEWEYAARGGGQDIIYPWGDDSPSCTYAVINKGGYGCGMDRTWSVCSKPDGNTAQGLCDMAGNVFEWVQDWYHGSYDCDANPSAINCGSGGIAPSDGSAWEDPSGWSGRVVRGGSFADGGYLRARFRYLVGPSARYRILGCRCAR